MHCDMQSFQQYHVSKFALECCSHGPVKKVINNGKYISFILSERSLSLNNYRYRSWGYNTGVDRVSWQ